MIPVHLGRTFVFLLLGSVAAGVACGSSSSGSSSNNGDASTEGGSGAVVARFDVTTNPTPNFLDVPFPSDVYLQGGKVMTIPGMDAYSKENSQFLTHELAKMDGFSRVALAFFLVDDTAAPLDDNGNVAFAKLDPATFPQDEASCNADASSLFLVDLDATDPTKARVPCRSTYHVDYINPKSRPVAAIGPAQGVPLAEAHHYAAVLTSRVKAADGRAVTASADFQKVQSGDPSAPAAYTGAYTKVKAALASALASDGASIVAIAPYTTNAMTRPLYALRDALEGAP